MSDNNIAVKITADIVDMQTKFTLARAQVNGLTVEMNKLARASAAGVIDPAGSAKLTQLSGDLIAARIQAQGYAGSLEKAGISVSTFGRQVEGTHGSISTATREFRALFDELSSGRTRMTPGTLAIIAQRVLGLGPAALGAVAGVGALAAGIGYLAYRAIEADHALNNMTLGAQFAGNLSVTREELQTFSEELAKTKGISASNAREIVAAFAAMKDSSVPLIHALALEVNDFAKVTGQSATTAKDEMVKLFSSDVSAADFAKKLGGVAQTQINMAEAADRAGNSNQVNAAKLEIFNSVLDRSRHALDEQSASMTASLSNFAAYAGLSETFNTEESMRTTLLNEQNTARGKQIELLREQAAALASAPPSRDQALKTGVETSEKENPVEQQVTAAKAKIAEMTAALQIAKERADQVSIDKLTAGLAKAGDELSNLQFGPVLERMREQMQEVAATWDGTQEGLLAKQIQISRSMLADVQANTKERISIQSEIARLEVEMHRAAGAEMIADARNQIAVISAESKRGPVERLEAERDVWAQILTSDQVTSQQRVEVQRAFNASVVALARERKTQTDEIEKSDAQTEISIARLNLDAKRAALEADVSENRITAAQKLAILRDLATQDELLSERAVNAELAGLQAGTAQYERVYNQIRELKAKLNLDLENFDRQYQADVRRQLREETTAWKMAVGEIENAESTLISDIVSRRRTLSQTLLQLSTQVVTQEIANDVKAFTTKQILNNSEKALEQGGVLYHLLFDKQKTASTATNQTAQTSAVTTGASARLAAQTAANAATQAQQAAIGPALVMAYAAEAAAGAFAAIAAIPYVGPFLAPEASLAAYAEVAAYAPAAALDVGAWNLKQGGIYELHQGETVVPKTFAEGQRRSGGSAFGAGGSGGDMHVHIKATDSRGVERQLRQGGILEKEIKRLHSGYRR